MKLMGLMIVRNEDWVLPASLEAALAWCDGVVVLDHASEDRTPEIAEDTSRRNPDRVYVTRVEGDRWDEMDHRQASLELGRAAGGTHFATVDADEILTANLRPRVRSMFETLAPGERISLPLFPLWRSLRQYRDDDSKLSRSWVKFGFADAPALSWQPRGGGYQHHRRAPVGSTRGPRPFKDRAEGGVMHLQSANWKRLEAKHVWYRMVEVLRWPDRKTEAKLNAKYDEPLDETNIRLSECPADWWSDHPEIDLNGESWYETAIAAMLAEHGRERFGELDLKGR